MIATAGAGVARSQDEVPSELKTIAAVRLEGRSHVGAKEIRSALKTREPSWLPWREKPVIRRDFVVADAQTIEAVYRQHGYLDAHVTFRLESGKRPGSAVVIFTIVEGGRSRVGSVEFEGVNVIAPDQLRKKLYTKPGKPFNPSLVVADTAIISDAFKERGYLPRVVGMAGRESGDSLRILVRYVVNEGRPYRNGEVYLSTPDQLQVHRNLIMREVVVKPGEMFKASRVQRSVERLYETGLLSQVQMSLLPDSSNTRIDYDLRVRTRKPRWIDAGVGSGTAERFRFTGEWGHRNLGGRALQGVLSSKAAFDGQARFLLTRTEASLLEPWLFGTRTRGQATIYYENSRDRADPRWVVSQDTRGFGGELRRDLGRFSKLALTQDNAYVQQKITLRDADLAPAIRDSLTLNVVPSFTTHRVELALDRDTRDDPLNPGRGSAQNLTGDVAGGPFRGTSSFTKWQGSSSWYTPFRKNWVLATRVRGGAIDPFGKEAQFSPDVAIDPRVQRVPLNDRFRIGGVNSLRGYNESEIPLSGGLALILANVELRIPVAGPLGLELFVDAGNVWSRMAYIKAGDFVPRVGHQKMTPNDVRYVFGLGGRLNLPFGPLRVDFTWSPRPDERGEWKVAEPQFAIGPSF